MPRRTQPLSLQHPHVTEGGGHSEPTATRVHGGGSIVTHGSGSTSDADVAAADAAPTATALSTLMMITATTATTTGTGTVTTTSTRELHRVDGLPRPRLKHRGAFGDGQDHFVPIGVYDARFGSAVARGAGA